MVSNHRNGKGLTFN